ncbi:ribbon-helix-helix domain-containing protein (plasmid) [Citricoccus nitrophenolicus]
MKISVSLPAADVETLDEYARSKGFKTRSAAIQHAVAMLRTPDLEHDYEQAWDEWQADGSGTDWDATAGDGMADAAR